MKSETHSLVRIASGAVLAAATTFSCSEGGEKGILGSGGSGNVPLAGSGGVPVVIPDPSAAGQAGGGVIIPPMGGCEGLSCQQTTCTGNNCQQVPCANGASTTLSGTVFDPSGTLPLYNAMVFVPNAELEPLSTGPSCACEVSGKPIAAALTDSHGRFVLENAPVGTDIPVVVQVGKWRRRFSISTVAACTDNPQPDGTLRLPARQSEGDIPRIALTTGALDALECLFRKLGLDPSEFTTPEGAGRLNYFAGSGGTNRYADAMNGGAAFPAAGMLWGDLESLRRYDVVLMSCEGGTLANQKGAQAFQAMHDYANLGGRVFASHWHQVWFQRGPAPFPDVASFVSEDDLGDITANVVTTFPKGQALSEWLVNVQASMTPGLIPISGAQYTVTTENPQYAQRWIASDTPASVQYLSANTPFGAPAEQQCGRVVLSDIHLAGDTDDMSANIDRSGPNRPFPEGCITTGLSPQEKVLAFMLFDISACVVPDDMVPQPPR